MKQLTIAVSSNSGAHLLYNRLTNMLQMSSSVHYEEQDQDHRYCIHVRLENSDLEVNIHNWTTDVTKVIAQYIIDDLEMDILQRIIWKQRGSYTTQDMDEILLYCKRLIDETDQSLEVANSNYNRMLGIQNELKEHMLTCQTIDIEGFIHFRLKKYIRDLQDTVEYAMDEFLLNHQYREFIALLKYFVYFQDTKIPKVHLIHQGGNKFQLFDENLKPINLMDTEDVIVETVDRELNYEDMVVSALISVSPKSIHIHTREPETQSIKTILQIFEGRTWICTSCHLCKPSLGEWKAEQYT